MNKFACIKYIKEYNKVVYYSIVINGLEENKSLFEMFVEENESNKEKLNHILIWLKLIGNAGARVDNFRHEREADALPPRGLDKKPTYTENDENTPNNLRLYCHRLNEQVVVLFGGGIKTEAVAQNCKNVGSHFELANSLATAIENAFRTKEIEWAQDYSDILYESNLKLIL